MDLVVVGHLALNEDRTSEGTAVSMGGSAYYCAVGAHIGDPVRVGIVAPVGDDFDRNRLKRLGVDGAGIRRYAGKTPSFLVIQASNGGRAFEAEWGVADRARLDAFPSSYAAARHVHLATAPPQQQMAWITWLRGNHREATMSVDLFEPFAEEFPDESRAVCEAADLVFLNAEESRRVAWTRPEGRARATVLKRGPQGAEYLDRRSSVAVGAPQVHAVDTTGAGDILAGVFLALRCAGTPPEVALRHAVSVATASVQAFGVDTPHVANAIESVRTEVSTSLSCAGGTS